MMRSGIENPAHTVYQLVDANLKRCLIFSFIDADALHELQGGKLKLILVFSQQTKI